MSRFPKTDIECIETLEHGSEELGVSAASEKIVNELRLVVAETLAHLPGARDISLNGQLREHGVVSIDLVAMLLAVEARFGIQIPSECMTPENFRTLGTVAGLIATLSQQATVDRDLSEG